MLITGPKWTPAPFRLGQWSPPPLSVVAYFPWCICPRWSCPRLGTFSFHTPFVRSHIFSPPSGISFSSAPFRFLDGVVVLAAASPPNCSPSLPGAEPCLLSINKGLMQWVYFFSPLWFWVFFTLATSKIFVLSMFSPRTKNAPPRVCYFQQPMFFLGFPPPAFSLANKLWCTRLSMEVNA